jgi:hypothetical protein
VAVLPEKREIAKVGGPGNECLVAGIHFKFGPQSEGAASELHYGEIPGAWRIEESPAAPAAEDYFLNVIMVTDKDSKERPTVTAVPGAGGEIAIKVTKSDGATATVFFAKGDASGASLKLEREGKVVFEGKMPDKVVLEEGRP